MRKRVLLFAVIIILALVLAFLWFASRSKVEEAMPTPTPPLGPTPAPTSVPRTTLTPTPSPTPSFLQVQQNKKLVIARLPYIGDGFTVEYFPDRDWFFIQINKPPYETYEAAAKSWLTGRGLAPENLNIEWGSTRGIAPKQ